jgi:hypothetical protein
LGKITRFSKNTKTRITINAEKPAIEKRQKEKQTESETKQQQQQQQQ